MSHDISPADRCRDWICHWLAKELDRESASIDPDENLLNYGMDSVNAIMLIGDLESEFGLRLPPTLVWDHPTVNSLVVVIDEQVSQTCGETKPTHSSKGPLDPAEAARLLENIDQLSDEQVDSLLSQLSDETGA